MIPYLVCGLSAVIFMSMVFVFAERLKRYDVVDAAWGMTFIVVALVSFFTQPGTLFEIDLAFVATLLVLVWGGRLTFHIVKRLRASSSEDPRYTALRKNWKGSVRLNAYIKVYLLQAVLALIISAPVIHINSSSVSDISPLAWVGIVVWSIGFWLEAVGDRQLRRFVSDPDNKGKLMREGLWKYSRHPNYFGELVQWWGIFILCLTVPYGLVGVIGPVLISYLIVFVSGIPLNEKRFEGRPGWDEYRAHTSMLIPLPPK